MGSENEDGHSKLSPNWLVEEMEAAEKEVAAWPAGLRESFEKSCEVYLGRLPLLSTKKEGDHG